MADADKKETPIRAIGWASLRHSPTHAPMRLTAPPTPFDTSTPHPRCQEVAELIRGASAYCTKAYQFLACGDWRRARLCVEHALRCLRRAHNEMPE